MVANTKEKTPLVSVIMPAYNADRFIESAIRSVMEQTVSDWELLVIDDGSSDATCEILERLAAGDDRIKFYKNSQIWVWQRPEIVDSNCVQAVM